MKITKKELTDIFESIRYYEESLDTSLIELLMFKDEDEVFENLLHLIGQMGFEVFCEETPNPTWGDIVYLLESSNMYLVFKLKDGIAIARFED